MMILLPEEMACIRCIVPLDLVDVYVPQEKSYGEITVIMRCPVCREPVLCHAPIQDDVINASDGRHWKSLRRPS